MKIAFTGTHGTGKTTSMFNYAYMAKVENPTKKVEVFHENAAKAPKNLINKSGTEESQIWIFTNQIRTEIELTSMYDIVICDRTCFDSIAYGIYMGFENLANTMFELALKHLPSYNKIFFKSIQKNNHLYKCEHRDITDLDYRQKVEDILLKLYKKTGITDTNNFIII